MKTLNIHLNFRNFQFLWNFLNSQFFQTSTSEILVFLYTIRFVWSSWAIIYIILRKGTDGSEVMCSQSSYKLLICISFIVFTTNVSIPLISLILLVKILINKTKNKYNNNRGKGNNSKQVIFFYFFVLYWRLTKFFSSYSLCLKKKIYAMNLY